MLEIRMTRPVEDLHAVNASVPVNLRTLIAVSQSRSTVLSLIDSTSNHLPTGGSREPHISGPGLMK